MSSIPFNHGTDKARGLENAALQHLKHQHKTEQEVPSTATNPQAGSVQSPQSQPITSTANDPHLVAKVELNQPASAPQTSYSPSTVLAGSGTTIIGNGAKVNIESTGGAGNGNDTLIIGNGAKVNITGAVGVDNGNDTLIIGNGAKVNIESTVGVDNGNDTLIIGNGAKVDIKGTVGVDNGNDTLIIGNGAKVTINGSVGVDNSHDTLIIGNGAKVEINGSAASTTGTKVIIGSGEDVKIDGTVGLGNDGFTYKDGKLSVHLKDDKNQSFRWELNVKNQQDAETLIATMKDRLKEKKVNFDDLRRSVQGVQDLMKQRDDMIAKFKDGLHQDPFKTGKGFNHRQSQLDMKLSLINQLMQPQGKSEESLHSKMVKLTEQLHDLHKKDK